jgi:hypothetical protein
MGPVRATFWKDPRPLLVLWVALPATTIQAQLPVGKPGSYAQQLVNQTRARHPALKGVELALVRHDTCATVAATAPEDVGERCDADELGPIRSGRPDVEEPTKADPVYDITQALHDSAGRLIGAVGMDIAPQPGEGRAVVLAFAQTVRREMEQSIPSAERLLEAP